MRIALLSDGLFPYKVGGMQKHSLYLAYHLATLGVEVDLYYTIEKKTRNREIELSDLLPGLDSVSINFHPIDAPESLYFPGHYLWKSYLISKIFYAKLDTSCIDFVFAQGFTAWYFLKLKHRDFKIGVHPHALNMFDDVISYKDFFQKIIFRWAMRKNLHNADCVFSLGEGFGQKLSKISKNRPILFSSNGISENWTLNRVEKKISPQRQFIFVGRNDPIKGVKELHTVINSLHKKNENFHIEIIGPFQKSEQLNIPNLTYRGEIKNEIELRSIYRQSDILVCPSQSEGMPSVILEAMASGLAIIATDVGAVGSLVSRKNGWLIPPSSSAHLKQAFLEAINITPELLLLKQQQSQKKLKSDFLWDKVARKTLSEIEHFLDD